MKENTEETQISNEDQVNNTQLIYAPRSAWLEFILTFSTFTISAHFWLVARVREIRRLSGKNFTPWLWFFVPSIALAQLFALPKLFNAMDDIYREKEGEPKDAWRPIVFIFLVAGTIMLNVSEKIEFSPWVYFLALLLSSLAITVLQHRFNQIKVGLKDIPLTEIKSVYRVWEWILLVVGMPIMLIALYSSVLNPILVDSEDIPRDTTLIYPDQPFQLTISDKGWSKVEAGTYSDGSAVLELSGPLFGTYYVVFKHGLDNTVNSVSYGRQYSILGENSKTSCTHSRKFEDETLEVSALVICEGNFLGDPIINISKVIHTDQGIYEFYGYFTGTKVSFRKHKDNFINIANGFKVK